MYISFYGRAEAQVVDCYQESYTAVSIFGMFHN